MSDQKKEDLRRAALAYHQFPKPGKLEINATKPLANGRDLSRALIRRALRRPAVEIKNDPATRAPLYSARQSGRSSLQWLSCAGAGQHRGAGLQTGDGRQGGPVQEVRQHRLF